MNSSKDCDGLKTQYDIFSLDKAETLALLHGCGFSYDELKKPRIAVFNTLNPMNPGHIHQSEIAKAVADGVREAGGLPVEFNGTNLCDSMLENQKYTLPSRDLLVNDIDLPPIAKETKMTSINLTDKAVKDFDFLFHGSILCLLGMMYNNFGNQGVQQRGRQLLQIRVLLHQFHPLPRITGVFLFSFDFTGQLRNLAFQFRLFLLPICGHHVKIAVRNFSVGMLLRELLSRVNLQKAV